MAEARDNEAVRKSVIIPRREDLIERLRRANQFAWPFIFTEIFLIALVAFLIDWQRAIEEPLYTTIALGVAAGPLTLEILKHLATKRTRVEDLKEQTRFGQYDKYRLQSLFRDTVAKLGLPDQDVSLYLLANRTMNASAMHLGFGPMFRSINGIYLHRQVLHKLNPAEIQDLIGHELGHYYKHYLVVDRFRSVTVILSVLVSMFVVQRIGLDETFGYVLMSILPVSVWWFSGLFYARHATSIEYLCDDFGAQAGGIIPSINGLMKLGAEAEFHSTIMQQAILSKGAQNLSAIEIVEAIQASIPYGADSREEIEKIVKVELRKRAENRNISLIGFLNYAWNSEQEAVADAIFEKEAKKLKKLQNSPRLDWESLLQDPRQIAFDEISLPRFIAMMESQPEVPLFRIEEGGEMSDGVHPPLRSRILFLWYNRKM